MASALQLGRNFLTMAAGSVGFDLLFENLTDVCFFAKDAEGRFVRANRAFVKLVRAANEVDVIGRRDEDFFPGGLAQNYRRDDRAVLESGEAMLEKAELVQHTEGGPAWFCTTKLPVLDAQRRVVGICGITRDVKQLHVADVHSAAWDPVLESMLSDYALPLDTAELASRVGLSVSQFNRQFRQRFRTTPRAYLADIRMDVACHLLTTTDLSMAEIAQRTGFYDQAHFANQFVKRRSMPPSKYRNRFAVA